MKLIGEIIGVESHGDSLAVDIQAEAIGGASWRALEKQRLIVPCGLTQKKALYVGRSIKVEFSFPKERRRK